MLSGVADHGDSLSAGRLVGGDAAVVEGARRENATASSSVAGAAEGDDQLLAQAGFPDPSTYVIVREQTTPHETPETAQPLPNARFFGVLGSLGSGDSIDLYRMRVAPGTGGIQLLLATDQPSGGTPLVLWLFDASGHVVGSWTANSPTGGPLMVDLTGSALSSTIYLGISTAAAMAPQAATDYQLWVAREGSSGAGADTGIGLEAQAAPLSPVFPTGPLTSFLTASAPRAIPISSPNFAGSALASAPQAPSARAAQAAGPFGGSASADVSAPAPLTEPTVLARVQLAAPSRQTAVVEAEVDSAATTEPFSEAQTALRAPGGFPLLSATAVGEWRQPSATLESAAREDPAGSEPVSLSGLVCDGPQSAPRVALAGDSNPESQRAPLPLARAWSGLSVSLSSSLGVALALTLNAAFSDPVAGFDYLAMRFDGRERSPRRSNPDPKSS